MINRVLIRIRVIQTLFSYYIEGDSNVKSAEIALLDSLQKSYDLYFYFLQLIVELTDEYDKKIEAKRNKLLPTAEDMNPNTKLVNNRFVKQLRENTLLTEYLNDSPFDWTEHDSLIRKILETILKSTTYQEYLSAETDDYTTDKDFWRKAFKQIICTTEDLYNVLEDESIYWNDDIEIVESFTIKTIKQFEEEKGADQELLPMFRDESDEEFAVKLLKDAITEGKEHKDLIEKYTQNWDTERIANMDMIIMLAAITEIKNFPSIPISVTLNEYINISKSYSTAKSASFINGVLDALVKDLQAQKVIFKMK